MSTYFAPTYFESGYFGALGVRTAPHVTPTSDFQVFSSIELALRQTNRFASVNFPESRGRSMAPGQPMPSVAIIPLSFSEVEDVEPGMLLRTVRFELLLGVWMNDARAAYEQLVRLSNLCQNVLDGASLDGLVMAARLRLPSGGPDLESCHPAKRFSLSGEFSHRVSRSVGRPT